jgi:diguanylate cyclase (GGDEF)-like protein
MNTHLRSRIDGMSSQEIYDALYRDQLTQALNRRAFLACGFQAVAIVDMDSLKYLNDVFGHRTGDEYLCQLAGELRAEFGAEVVYRLGGDEFAVTGADKRTLRTGLERVRARFQGLSYGVALNLTKADVDLRADKSRREAAGLRAGRGEMPPWAVEKKIA